MRGLTRGLCREINDQTLQLIKQSEGKDAMTTNFFTEVTDKMVMWPTGIEKQSRCTLDAHDNKYCFAVAGHLDADCQLKVNGRQVVCCIGKDVRGKIKSRHFTHKKKYKVPKVPQSHIPIC